VEFGQTKDIKQKYLDNNEARESDGNRDVLQGKDAGRGEHNRNHFFFL